MKVLVLGATGVTGRSTLPALLAAGHEVFGHARDQQKARLVAQLGAVPVLGDSDDAHTLQSWLSGVLAAVDLRGETHVSPAHDPIIERRDPR